MDNLDRVTEQKGMKIASLGFTVIHLILATLCFLGGVRWMALVSLVCAGGCCGGYFLASREKYRLQTQLIYTAQLLQLVLTIFCVGRSAGFLLPLLGVTLFVFFCEYLGRTLGHDYLPSAPVTMTSGAVCLLLLMKVSLNPAARALLPENIRFWMQVVWGVPLFALSLAGVYVLVHMATDSERILTDRVNTDKLTGLINRAGYEQILTQIDIKTTTLILFDADKFKLVNDNYGHEIGDRVLQKIARVLKQNFRLRDCVCRLGGDEFVILMLGTDVLERDQIMHKISRINRELSHVEDRLPIITLSAGIAWGGNESDWKTMFNHADQAMYQVKQGGGRGCKFHS